MLSATDGVTTLLMLLMLLMPVGCILGTIPMVGVSDFSPLLLLRMAVGLGTGIHCLFYWDWLLCG